MTNYENQTHPVFAFQNSNWDKEDHTALPKTNVVSCAKIKYKITYKHHLVEQSAEKKRKS